MNEIVSVIIQELVTDLGCRWATLAVVHDEERNQIGSAGDVSGAADETISVAQGASNVVLEFAFRPETPETMRNEAHILGASLVNGFVSMRVVRDEESTDTGTILIVDDDIGVRTLVRHVLEREGFDVIEAPNGLIGHARALEFKPDLIIIDWMMPELDGHEAAIRLKADPFTAAAPIVMLTSRSQASDKVEALAAGVQDFLTKPFEPAELTDAVRQQLRWRRLLADESADVVATSPARPALTVEAPNLARFIEVAELAEEKREYDEAAQAYGRAADLAVSVANPDIGNKFRRLAGKMYLLLAESASDALSIQHGYTSAARAFLTAGNITLAATAHKSAKEAVSPGS
jgi:DNA-binding response OmpR family regulator